MGDFRLHWAGAEVGSLGFQEIDLIYCPRIGEQIWFPFVDDSEEIFAITATVEGVLHVAESEEYDAYVELHLTEDCRIDKYGRDVKSDDEEESDEDDEDDADEDDEADSEDRGCEYAGLMRGKIDPSVREAIMQAALEAIRRKHGPLESVGSTRVEM